MRFEEVAALSQNGTTRLSSSKLHHMSDSTWMSFVYKVFQIIRCLIKPLLKNSTQTIFPGGTPWVAQLLNNVNVWMVLYCAQQFLGLKKKSKPFLHLSLSKAGPFTLGSHICSKALKWKVFQIIRCLIKPLVKKSTQTIFQGGTPWVAQLLNNVNVWMVLYCAQQLLGLEKETKTLSPPFFE